MIYSGELDSYFEVVDLHSNNTQLLSGSKKSELSLIWFQSNDNEINIDGKLRQFNKNEIITFTEFHTIDPVLINGAKMLRFNKAFYCIIDHDSEVGCKGVLYFGSSELPKITLDANYLELISAAWKMLELEMRSQDDLQGEMLQMMLKRILIFCTRVFKEQSHFNSIKDEQIDLIRQFSFLVERHFRKQHKVLVYARMLHKSPKTLANTFHKVGERSPSQLIQDRILLEAKRLLSIGDHNVSEVAEELGFIDLQSFSRFFKKQTGVTALQFKDSSKGKK